MMCNDALPELQELLCDRATFYDMLASFYFRPLSQNNIEDMAAIDWEAYADINEDMAAGVNDIVRVLSKRHSGTREQLAADFAAAFAGASTYEGRTAAPYKSVFTSNNGLLMQEAYQQVFDAFKAECVKKREGFDWPDDHLSILFQFLALMSRRAAQCLQEGDVSGADRILRVSRDFLDEHILSWFDELQSMAVRLVKTRFYRGVLLLTRGYLYLDKEVLDDAIVELASADVCTEQQDEGGTLHEAACSSTAQVGDK